MTAKPTEGNIITVQDLIDMMVYYLMPVEPKYLTKITVICYSGFRMNIEKDAKIGNYYFEQRRYYNYINYNHQNLWGLERASDFRANSTNSLNLGDFIHYIPGLYTGSPAKFGNSVVSKILDPADNSVYEGVDKHVIVGTMPTPGDLISVTEINSLLNANGQKMYNWTHVFVYEWSCYTYENRHRTPPWSVNGAYGWKIIGSWQYTRLDNASTTNMVNPVQSTLQLKEDDLITYTQFQNLMSNIYQVVARHDNETIHALSCHDNCHHSCHCRRW